MRIGLDLDGVVFNFTKAYNTHLRKLGYPVDPEKEATTWDYFLEFGISTEQFLEHMDEMVDAKTLFWEMELCEPEIPDLIRDFREEGHEIHIVTHRFSGKKECAQEATKFCLAKYGIEYESLTFTGDKTSVSVEIFLEDNRDNYDKLVAAGVAAWLVNRPYNQDDPGELRYRYRVDSFKDFARLILPETSWQSRTRVARR